MMMLKSVSEKQMTWEELSKVKVSELSEEKLKTYKAQVFWAYKGGTSGIYNYISELIKQVEK